MRGVGLLAGDDALELGELLHEVELRVEAARGIDDDGVGVPALGSGESVEYDGGRVGALLVGDDVGADAVAPRFELFDRRGTEGVGSGDDGGAALLLVGVGELSDGRRFAGAVDAEDKDHGGLGRRGMRAGAGVGPETALAFGGLQ